MNPISQFFIRALDILLPQASIEKITLETFLSKTQHTQHTQQETSPIPATNIHAVFSYKHPLVKEAVHNLKFKGSKHAAHLLAHGLYPAVLEYLSDTILFKNTKPVLLIPVPLSKKRLRQRGYNQAEVLAEKLIRMFEENEMVLAPDVLQRVQNTKPQTNVGSRKERLQNVLGCFDVQEKEKVAGRNIILLDDVTTTGATLNEARRTVLRCGAKSVFAVAAAH